MTLSRSIILACLLAFTLAACKDSTSPPDNSGSTDTSRLAISKSTPDTLYGKPNSSVSVTFTISRSGKLQDSARVSYLHPITGSSLLSDYSVQGKTTITIDIPATTTAGLYPVTFIAVKRDVTMSDTLRMYLRVDGRADLKMSLKARGETNGIGLSWSRQPSDNSADTAYLESSTGEVVAKSVVMSPASDTHFSGLVQGKIYSLYVNSTVALSEHVHWALSKRYGPVRVMEGQGIVLASGDVLPTTASSALDVVLATDPASPALISLVSPSVASITGMTNGRATHFSDFYIYGQSVDSLYYQKDFSTKFDSNATTIELDLQFHPSLIFQVITADGNYAQIGIVPQDDGRLIGVTADQKRFVDLRVSYQPIPNLPYASRASTRSILRRLAHSR